MDERKTKQLEDDLGLCLQVIKGQAELLLHHPIVLILRVRSSLFMRIPQAQRQEVIREIIRKTRPDVYNRYLFHIEALNLSESSNLGEKADYKISYAKAAP